MSNGMHLCGSIYGSYNSDQTAVTCPHLVYCTDDNTYAANGKKMQKYYVYCTANGRVRSMGNAASWTGNSPTWCPRRQE